MKQKKRMFLTAIVITLLISIPTQAGSRVDGTLTDDQAWITDTQSRWSLAVDDGSTDSSWAALTRYAAQEPRLQIHQHECNRGKGAAIRTAVARATGETVSEIARRGFQPLMPESAGESADDSANLPHEAFHSQHAKRPRREPVAA